MSQVTFRVSDFVGEEGVEYTDIEVIVEMAGGLHDAVQVVEALQRPFMDRGGDE